MKAHLSPKDWQQISEYLDDQLTPKEKSRLEERIRIRPELSDGLEELRHTRLVLRSVPKRRVPHNFILTPEMVRPRSLSRLFPVLSFSSALATVLIIVTLVIRLLPGSASSSAAEVERLAAPALPAAPAAAPFTSSATQDNLAGTQTSPMPEIIIWGQSQNNLVTNNVQGAGARTGGQTSPPMSAAPLISPGGIQASPSQEAPAQAPVPEVSSPPVPLAPGLAQPEAQALAVPTNEVSMPAAAALKGSSPILGIPARNDQGKIISAPTAELSGVEAVASHPVAQSFQYWILLEVALVVIALASGLAAYSLWRNAKM